MENEDPLRNETQFPENTQEFDSFLGNVKRTKNSLFIYNSTDDNDDTIDTNINNFIYACNNYENPTPKYDYFVALWLRQRFDYEVKLYKSVAHETFIVGVEDLINYIVVGIEEINKNYNKDKLTYYKALLKLFYDYALPRIDKIKEFIKEKVKKNGSYQRYIDRLDPLIKKVDNLLNAPTEAKKAPNEAIKAPNEAKKGYFSQMWSRLRPGGKSKKKKNKRSKSRKSRSVKRR